MRYRTIVADPPWQYRPGVAKASPGPSAAERHYETAGNEVIAAIPVAELADDDAHLYMWVTNPILTEQRLRGGPTACEIVRRWGFEPKTLLTWLKSENGAGMGWFFRGDTEHVIFAVRGDLPIPSERRVSNVSFAAHAERTLRSQIRSLTSLSRSPRGRTSRCSRDGSGSDGTRGATKRCGT